MRALARSWHSPCASWSVCVHAWARLATSTPACACVVVTLGRHGQVQGSAESVQDMVVHH
jgi:hypothetical protein